MLFEAGSDIEGSTVKDQQIMKPICLVRRMLCIICETAIKAYRG